MTGKRITDEDRKKIDKKFICTICNLLLCIPMQTHCGHLICLTCLQELLEYVDFLYFSRLSLHARLRETFTILCIIHCSQFERTLPFSAAVPHHQEALQKSGYNHKLQLETPTVQNLNGSEVEMLYGSTHSLSFFELSLNELAL